MAMAVGPPSPPHFRDGWYLLFLRLSPSLTFSLLFLSFSLLFSSPVLHCCLSFKSRCSLRMLSLSSPSISSSLDGISPNFPLSSLVSQPLEGRWMPALSSVSFPLQGDLGVTYQSLTLRPSPCFPPPRQLVPPNLWLHTSSFNRSFLGYPVGEVVGTESRRRPRL